MSRSERPRAKPRIMHIDDHLLVVDKPAGFLLGEGDGQIAGVVETLRGVDGLSDQDLFHIVHRYEPAASGVAVYARTTEAKSRLCDQLEAGGVSAVFLALVSGLVDADGEIDHNLHFDKRSGSLKASEGQGSPARTLYQVRERVAGNTLLECRPDSLRSEQVRLHLTAIGHPLTVDLEFGGGRAVLLSDYKPGYRPNKRRAERPLIDRLTLHVESLSLEDPGSGERRTFSAPLPRDMRATIKQLGRWR